MYRTYAFRKVYWAGTAFFLMADVELRRRTGGKKSLDTAVAALEPRTDGELWDADELLAELDRAVGEDVFVPLARRVLARDFPGVDRTLAELGIRMEGDGVRLDDAAPLAALRRQIMAPR